MTSHQSLSFQGACFCGAASFRVEGKPLISVYCHCTVCQRVNGCVFVHGLHFPTTSFTWTHDDPEAVFTKSLCPSAWQVWWCKGCYSFIAAHNASEDKWSVKASHLRRNEEGLIENYELLKPKAHIFYGTRMFSVEDGLPKWEGYEYKSKRIDVDVEEKTGEMTALQPGTPELMMGQP